MRKLVVLVAVFVCHVQGDNNERGEAGTIWSDIRPLLFNKTAEKIQHRQRRQGYVQAPPQLGQFQELPPTQFNPIPQSRPGLVSNQPFQSSSPPQLPPPPQNFNSFNPQVRPPAPPFRNPRPEQFQPVGRAQVGGNGRVGNNAQGAQYNQRPFRTRPLSQRNRNRPGGHTYIGDALVPPKGAERQQQGGQSANEAHPYYYPPRMPLPLPSCFHNPTGYACCNAQLNDLIVETYTELEAKPKFHTCNINAIANMIQNKAEKHFNTTFETIAAFEDFAQKIHFHGDLVCKVELGGKYMLAYGTVKDVHEKLAPEQVQVVKREVPFGPEKELPINHISKKYSILI